MTKKRTKLTSPQVNKLKRLMNMQYTPAELANEIGISADRIYRTYIPAGCPHTRDESGRIWIVGAEFRNWAYRELRPRPREKLSDQQAWCMRCRGPVEIVAPIKIVPTGKHTELISGRCPQCGGPVNRARAKT